MDGHRRLVVGMLLLATVAACPACRRQEPPRAAAARTAADRSPRDAEATPRDDIRAAIDRSAHYLAGICDQRGQFTYRSHLDPVVGVRRAYNELRHAGAVYALAQYCQRSPDPAVQDAMLRGARFLRTELLAPLPGNPQLLAAWLPPELEEDPGPRQSKLGGAGLALVALVNVEQVVPGSTPLDELRALGRFIIFMQKSNGTFYSKFIPDTGRSDLWESEYYPGEAALGLLMLYRQDPSPSWLEPATKALHGIVLRGAANRPTLPDHWYLLAVAQMLQLPPDATQSLARDPVLAHARQICADMVHEQMRQADAPQIAGCFTNDGRSCPTATRLEGLLAALTFLPADDLQLRTALRDAIADGMRFLLRCQIQSGRHAGAFPRILPGYPQRTDRDRLNAGEIRVDYVQHSLSAMLGFEAAFSSP